MKPSYLKLLDAGALSSRVAEAWRHMEDCDLYARYYHVDWLKTIKVLFDGPVNGRSWTVVARIMSISEQPCFVIPRLTMV